MDTVRSAEGTTIAFDRLGEGTPVILISGASTARTIHARLADLLAADFAVFNYDRRGRGDSGDTLPYAIEREIEDLHAVLHAAGGTAATFGNSSGAVLALHAAAAGLPLHQAGPVGTAVHDRSGRPRGGRVMSRSSRSCSMPTAAATQSRCS